MAFRTVIINTHSKLEYSLEYLVFRTPDSCKRILLDEIHTIILQSTAISITTALLAELSKRKIKVLICDEKQNPISEISSYYNAHNSSGRIFEQLSWNDKNKDEVWKYIVKEKIRNQAKTLYRKGKIIEYEQLLQYSEEVADGDITNREGHAAKVYFNNVYFKGFTRDLDCKLNIYLNYGYTILLSQFNRYVTSCGYLTQLGIHHKNEFNQFNLSCDLIEPFRFLIDEMVEEIKDENNWKDEIVLILTKEVFIDGKNQTLTNAIGIYCQSVFNALKKEELSNIKFIENKL